MSYNSISLTNKENKMDNQQRDFLNIALADFGASVTEDGFFSKGNRIIPSLKIKIVKGRMRFENQMTGELVASWPISSATITRFVQKFWFWEKK